MDFDFVETGKKVAKWYAIGGAVYAGAWVVDRAIRTARGVQPTFFAADEDLASFGVHTAKDFALWPIKLFNVFQRASSSSEASQHIPIVAALTLPPLPAATAVKAVAGLGRLPRRMAATLRGVRADGADDRAG
jgi:hypothetical protein